MFLAVFHPDYITNNSDLEKLVKINLMEVISPFTRRDKINPNVKDDIKGYLQDYQIIDNPIFYVKTPPKTNGPGAANQSTPQQSDIIRQILNPKRRIFFNIPVVNILACNKMDMIVNNAFFYLSTLLNESFSEIKIPEYDNGDLRVCRDEKTINEVSSLVQGIRTRRKLDDKVQVERVRKANQLNPSDPRIAFLTKSVPPVKSLQRDDSIPNYQRTPVKEGERTISKFEDIGIPLMSSTNGPGSGNIPGVGVEDKFVRIKNEYNAKTEMIAQSRFPGTPTSNKDNGTQPTSFTALSSRMLNQQPLSTNVGVDRTISLEKSVSETIPRNPSSFDPRANPSQFDPRLNPSPFDPRLSASNFDPRLNPNLAGAPSFRTEADTPRTPMSGSNTNTIVINTKADTKQPQDLLSLLAAHQPNILTKTQSQAVLPIQAPLVPAVASKKADGEAKFDEYTLFGLDHFLVQSNHRFLKKVLEEDPSENFKQGKLPLSINQPYLELLELRKPFKVSRNFYLLRLGRPTLVPGVFPSATASAIERGGGNTGKESIFFNNGFASIHLHKSFLNPGVLVYFYQTLVYIPKIENAFFVIIPEDDERKIFFHTDLKTLYNMLFEQVKRVNEDIHDEVYKPLGQWTKEKDFFSLSHEELRGRIIKILDNAHATSARDFTTILEKSLLGDADLDDEGETFADYTRFQNNADDIARNVLDHFKAKLIEYNLEHISFGEFLSGYKHPKLMALVDVSRYCPFIVPVMDKISQHHSCSCS